MAVTRNSEIGYIAATTVTDNVATYSSLTWVAGWEMVVLHAAASNVTGTVDNPLVSAVVSDGTNTLTLTRPSGGQIFTDYSLPGALGRTFNVAYARCSHATPGALSTGAGACTLTLTYTNNINLASAALLGLDMGTSASDPFRAIASVDSGDVSVADVTHANMVVEADGLAITLSFAHQGTFTQSASFTEHLDAAVLSTRRAQYQSFAIGSNQTISPLIDGSSTARMNSFLLWFKERNDPSLTTASTTPFEPGETVTFAGTALDVANSGARIRKVGGTNAFDALTGYSASSSTAATAVIANRPSRTPYTSEDGTTHTIEFVSTLSGVASGLPTAAITTNNFVPPTGFSRVTIVTPDLGANSLLSALGWTSVAGDQIEWDNTVNVSGTDVTITVNDDGTVALDSGVNPMPATVSFKWRAYSTVDEDWTGQASDTSDWATATFGDPAPGGGETGLMSMAMLRRRRRGG